MTEKLLQTPHGAIHYWISSRPTGPWLIFLPGLSADHHLFDKQVAALAPAFSCLVWDAPAHGLSRPFPLNFSMDGMARYVHAILEAEAVRSPILVGQSLGGYIAQAYMGLYPGTVAGFISIDSCPLGREYYTRAELYMLMHTRLMYRSIPWRLLVRLGSQGTACSPYGQALMRTTMESYSKEEYCALAAHGYQLLAQAVGAGREYPIHCPTLLLCGERDAAGSARRYNRQWAKKEGHPLVWIARAGHNANTDAPDVVNKEIRRFAEARLQLQSQQQS